VYSTWQLAKKYLQYYLHASNGQGHGMHSPFVFDFILRVLNNGNGYQAPPEIEALRQSLLSDPERLPMLDLGAGSRKGGAREKSVSLLARTAVKPRRYGQLLYRLARHYRPAGIIELGTSLGITTAYLATANEGARVTTIEGNGAIAARAGKHFEALGLKNIESICGNFDELLPRVLQEGRRVDLAYVDGNHRYEPTVRYFEQLLARADAGTIMVFDDIHWSEEMEKAWEVIKEHPSVRYSIDIFFLGFVFFRDEFKVKQHFTIRF
jgi:predicted O-methyltransferase YrrM